MNIKEKLLSILGIALAMAISLGVLTGCGDDLEGVVGTWYNEDEDIYIVINDGETGSVVDYDMEIEFTYTLEDNKIVMTAEDEDEPLEGTLEDGELSIDGLDSKFKWIDESVDYPVEIEEDEEEDIDEEVEEDIDEEVEEDIDEEVEEEDEEIVLEDEVPYVEIADVSEDDWSYPYVASLVDLGIMELDYDGYFYPDVPTTRGEFIYSLWLAFSSPSAVIDMSFVDVDPSYPYAEAVEWAYDAGITSGMGDGTFAPDLTIPREQAFTFLYRAMEYVGCAPTYDEESEYYAQITEFNDYLEISEWACDTIQLMMNVGLVTGSDSGYLWPKQDMTNAATASLLYNTLEYMSTV